MPRERARLTVVHRGLPGDGVRSFQAQEKARLVKAFSAAVLAQARSLGWGQPKGCGEFDGAFAAANVAFENAPQDSA